MLGVMPLTPGYSSFVVMPHVSGNTPHVSGTQPTPHGPIVVAADRDNERGTVTVDVEGAVPGVVGLRLADESTGCALDLTTVRLSLGVDGALAAPAQLLSAADAAGSLENLHPTVRESHVYVPIPAGRSTVTAAFRSDCTDTLAAAVAEPEVEEKKPLGLPTIPPFGPATYPASWTTDNTTGGDWVGKYGKAGYSLLAFDQGKDVTALPSWVHGLYPGAKGNNEAGVKSKFVGSSASNKAYLEDPRAGKKDNRALGWTSNSGNYNGADGSQGTVLNVNTTAGTKYKLVSTHATHRCL